MSRLFFINADAIAHRYFALSDSLGTIPSDDLAVIRAAVCGHCGQGPRTRIVGRTRQGLREWRDVCSTCAKPWIQAEDTDRVILRNEVDLHHRPGMAEDMLARRLDEWRVLRPVMEPRPRLVSQRRWMFTLTAWRAVLHPMVGSFRAAAEHGQGLEAGPWWTEDIVKAWVTRARHVITRRARDRKYGVRVPRSAA